MQTIGPLDNRRAALRAPATLIAACVSFVVTLAAPASAGDIDSEALFPLPLSVDLPAARVQLGERLFGDPRLSSNNALPCSGCHQLAQGGDDGRVRAITNSGQPGNLNTPTVFNSAFDFRHSRHGRFRTLEQQVEDDLHNPAHANTSWEELLPKLRADPDYLAGFSAVYAQGISRESVLDAIATFERSLVTPNAPFDRFLRGDQNALSDCEREGYRLFKAYGCTACHQGINVGGNMFQQLGILEPYQGDDNASHEHPSPDQDKEHIFKVPSLRNVAVTAPYFHDGAVATLAQAVRVMGRVQLGVDIPDLDVVPIVAFLATLTGEYQGRSLADSGTGTP